MTKTTPVASRRGFAVIGQKPDPERSRSGLRPAFASGVSFIFAFILLGLAALVSIGAGVWLLVLAFQKRVWWGLAVLFVPLANVVFTIVEWQAAKRPFFLSLLALPLCAGAWFAVPKDHPFTQAFTQRLGAPGAETNAFAPATEEAEDTSAAPAAAAGPTSAEIDSRLAALSAKEAALLARKKALDPRDKPAALALSHEIVAYNAELQEALAARQRLVESGALLVPVNTPAAGQIGGLPFTVEKATLKDGILTLRQGNEFFADREVAIFLFLKNGESPIGRKWEIGEGADAGSPHIHFSWKDAGQSLPKTKILMNDYRLHLEFASGKNGTVNGRIALAAPGQQKSRVNGTFTARIVAKH